MIFFSWIASAAIVLGAVISAFRAKQPSRFVMWMVAYLVLIAGATQIGLLYGWHLLHLEFDFWIVIAFTLYNIGNLAVIYGRALKGKKSLALPLVNSGGVLLGISMLILIIRSYIGQFSISHLVFALSALVVLIGMPIGLVLSSRSRKFNKQ